MHSARPIPFFVRRIASLVPVLALAFLVLAPTSAEAYRPRYAAIVLDAESGRVIEASNPDARSYPASLTKVMTMYLLFDALEQGKLHLASELPVSAHAAAQAPSKLGLEPGEHISVEDLILALVTKSANDAAVVAAEALGGNEPAFAAKMTRKARELGMRATTYRNASGLPNPGQVTTARDQATLARAMIHDHPRYYRYFATREFEFRGHVIASHNRVTLHYPGADGMKTGYINASGFNLITSAVHGGRRLIGVVFGGRTAAWRDQRMESLLDQSFARINNGGGVVEEARADETDAAPAPAAPPQHGRQTRVQLAAAKHLLVPPAAAAESTDEGQGDADPAGWSIQVGAFSGSKPAHHAAAIAARKLGGLIAEATIDVDKNHSGRHVVYRARLTGFTLDQAHAACRKLKRSRSACQVIAPDA